MPTATEAVKSNPTPISSTVISEPADINPITTSPTNSEAADVLSAPISSYAISEAANSHPTSKARTVISEAVNSKSTSKSSTVILEVANSNPTPRSRTVLSEAINNKSAPKSSTVIPAAVNSQSIPTSLTVVTQRFSQQGTTTAYDGRPVSSSSSKVTAAGTIREVDFPYFLYFTRGSCPRGGSCKHIWGHDAANFQSFTEQVINYWSLKLWQKELDYVKKYRASEETCFSHRGRTFAYQSLVSWTLAKGGQLRQKQLCMGGSSFQGREH